MLKVGAKCWHLKVKGNNYGTAKVSLEDCTVFETSNEHSYYAYYGLWNSKGESFYVPVAQGKPWQEAFETRKEAVEAAIREIESRISDMKFCHSLKLKYWRGKKRFQRALKKKERQLSLLRSEKECWKTKC